MTCHFGAGAGPRDETDAILTLCSPTQALETYGWQLWLSVSLHNAVIGVRSEIQIRGESR